jgi:uroporphyrinogen-III synthase
MPGFLVDRPESPALRVAVTRPRRRAAGLCALLRSHGFVPLLRSLVRIEPEPAAVVTMLSALTDDLARGRQPWLVLTSVEAVRVLNTARRSVALTEQSKSSDWSELRVACVGPETAAAAARAGLDIALMPTQWDSASLGDALRVVAPASRIYWPRAESADIRLKASLQAQGADVLDVTAYRTVPDTGGARRLERDLGAGRVDAVLLLSPSAVDAYAALQRTSPGRVIVGVIGRSTRARAEQCGIAVDVEPTEHSVSGLVEALGQLVNRQTLESGTGQ